MIQHLKENTVAQIRNINRAIFKGSIAVINGSYDMMMSLDYVAEMSSETNKHSAGP